MSKQQEPLNNFREIYIQFVHDSILIQMLGVLNSTTKTLAQKMDNTSSENKEIIEIVIKETLDRCLHYTLCMLQKYDDELVKVDEKSLEEVNDSLCKELHEKDELIAKCTRYPERIIISEDIELFEKTISKLAEIKDPKILEKLIDNFSDNCEFPEAMYNLIYDIEAYPNDMYVTTILSKLKDLCYNFECFKAIIYEIINDQECLEI